MSWLSVLLLGGSPAAWAANCTPQLAALDKAQGEGVAAAFTSAAACDPAKASEAFLPAMKRTGDVDSLGALAEAAIGAGLLAQVNGMLEQIPDYAARDGVAALIGAHCADTAPVRAFVLALPEIKGRGFVAWSRALEACTLPEVTSALEVLVASPPVARFDDKYAAVVDLFGEKTGVAGLPLLEKAAMASMAAGPFAPVLDAMANAVTPEGIGTEPSAADREALVAALGRLGAGATPEAAQQLADTLLKIGANDAAAGLLSKIYPKAVQPDGSFLWGVAAIESCGTDAVVHWAVVQEPGKRWSIHEAIAEPASGFKARLKCKDRAPYAVQVTAGPVPAPDAVETWAEKLALTMNGAKLREEKTLSIQ